MCIRDREKGHDVAERGRNLSGGERKRLSLARGFLRNSEILILDEPLANVDAENIERIEDLISVSYTHLDVYKRQPQGGIPKRDRSRVGTRCSFAI